MIAAMVTVRPELEAIAAFSEATRTNVSQVVVTGPGAPSIATVDDLAGQEVFVRKTSAYYDTLTKLNEQLKARGKPVVIIDEAPDVLEDDDILEMVNAGLAIDQAHSLLGPRQIIPGPLRPIAHAPRPPSAARTFVPPDAAPLNVDPHRPTHLLTLPFDSLYPKAIQTQNPSTLSLQSHVPSERV
jgi:hypothetical protein